MPDDKKTKRPEFKPPFPAAPTPPASDDVLTNDVAETDEPVVVETVPDTSIIDEVESPEIVTTPETSDDDEYESEVDAAPKREVESSGPKFVSKSATTLTREPVTSFLKADSKPVSAAKPRIIEPVREIKEIHSTPPAATQNKPVIQSMKHDNPERSRGEARSGSSSLFTTAIIIFSLIFGLAGWTLYFNTKFNFIPAPSLPSDQAGLVEDVTPTPEVSPTPINNRADITLEVLNGSGVAGMAARTAERLEALGYSVIGTGNADRSNYTETQILVAPEFDTAELLLSDLTREFDSASVSGELQDSTASARIIVGRDWAN
jgi:hypothetical protein